VVVVVVVVVMVVVVVWMYCGRWQQLKGGWWLVGQVQPLCRQACRCRSGLNIAWCRMVTNRAEDQWYSVGVHGNGVKQPCAAGQR
jgi:hypothetical protein